MNILHEADIHAKTIKSQDLKVKKLVSARLVRFAARRYRATTR